jgi:hypothetical protein
MSCSLSGVAVRSLDVFRVTRYVAVPAQVVVHTPVVPHRFALENKGRFPGQGIRVSWTVVTTQAPASRGLPRQ